jgi:hypothetical protein
VKVNTNQIKVRDKKGSEFSVKGMWATFEGDKTRFEVKRWILGNDLSLDLANLDGMTEEGDGLAGAAARILFFVPESAVISEFQYADFAPINLL